MRWRRHRDSGVAKKLFYALRPALALRWMRLQGRSALPPMHVGALLDGVGLDPGTLAEIARLIVRKAQLAEADDVAAPAAIVQLIDGELARAAALPDPDTRRRDAARDAAAALFRTMLERFAPR